MNKKTIIYDTAVSLFASQGYESTTTLQVAREVGVTEPAVFYHFKNKNTLFSTILEKALKIYLNRLEMVALSNRSAFECLEELIKVHFSIVIEEPEYARILLRTCPAKLEDPDSTCTKIYHQVRSALRDAIRVILENGMVSGEFIKVDVGATSNLLIAMINGLMSQQIAALENLEGVEAATIAFCRNALLKHDVAE